MLATILAFLTAHWGWIAGAGGLSALVSMFLPRLIENALFQHALGWALQSAKPASVIVGGWLKTGPLKHFIVLPIWLLAIAIAWLSRFLDGILSIQDDSARTMAQGIAKALEKVRSEDQAAYYSVKGLKAEAKEEVVSQIKKAVGRAAERR